MRPPVVVLDAAAFDVIDDERRGMQLRALVRRTFARGGHARCAAVTLAEVCRGAARTRHAESVVARRRGQQRIRVIPTDERLAKQVGYILHTTRNGNEKLGDAHVVAVCADADVAIVVTSDPDDINELATAIPGTRVTTRRPSLR